MLGLNVIHVIKMGRRVTCYASVFAFKAKTTKYSLRFKGYVVKPSDLLSDKYWELFPIYLILQIR